ncbi:hypothetical protein HS088_TW06G01134 [Tripterygium wilfordii]|uniref:Uncharacterized protein n=2 Tax=Tripterygium wilfordii TaxID=458696 RepID=A0A7J7DKX8_TRIWF|nr:hypothetical protein HS088_TW06G01134 [Tripterygium wilfordii]
MAGIRDKPEDQKVCLDLNVKAKDDMVEKEKPCKDGVFDLDLNVEGNDDMVEKEKPCKDGEFDLDLDDQRILVQEEFSDSLFSLSIDSRKRVFAFELGEKEVNSPVPKWGNSFFSSSNDETSQACEVEEPNPDPDSDRNRQPVANIKPRTTQSKQKQETQGINGPEPSSKLLACNARARTRSEGTSTSNITTNSGGNLAAEREFSPIVIQDEPNFGATTLEHVEQHSASASPKQCRKAPTLGTVGSFWVYTGQIKDADSEHPCEEVPRISTRM